MNIMRRQNEHRCTASINLTVSAGMQSYSSIDSACISCIQAVQAHIRSTSTSITAGSVIQAYSNIHNAGIAVKQSRHESQVSSMIRTYEQHGNMPSVCKAAECSGIVHSASNTAAKHAVQAGIR